MTSNKKIKITQESDGTQELLISALDSKDSGKYTCIVVMESGETMTTSGQVNVAGKCSFSFPRSMGLV